MKHITHLAGAVLCASAFLGCDMVQDLVAEKVSEKVTESVIEGALEKNGQGDADVDLSSGTVKVKTDKGSLSVGSGSDVAIPAGFPKDVIVPKDLTLKMALESDNNFNVTGESDSTPKSLAEKIAKDAESNGWKQKSKMDMGQMNILAYEKENRTLTVSISAADGTNNSSGKTIVTMSITAPKSN